MRPDYVRRSVIEAAEREQAARDYAEWTARALTVRCRSCRAQPGEPCTNKVTGRHLDHYAHPKRLQDAI